MSEVMNVLGDECRGDECQTIKFTFASFKCVVVQGWDCFVGSLYEE